MRNIYFTTSVNIFIMFIIAILASVVPEMYREWFGDIYCPAFNEAYPSICVNGYGRHGNEYHWGYRHCLWFWMGVLLFAVQIIRIINNIVNSFDKK
jgi:hypothetical protein